MMISYTHIHNISNFMTRNNYAHNFFYYPFLQHEEAAREEAREAKELARAEAREAAAAAARSANMGHVSPTQFSSRSYEMWAGDHGSEEQLKDIKSECGDSFLGSHGKLNGYSRTRKVLKIFFSKKDNINNKITQQKKKTISF